MSARDEFEDNEGCIAHWVNVSESSGASSPRLFRKCLLCIWAKIITRRLS